MHFGNESEITKKSLKTESFETEKKVANPLETRSNSNHHRFSCKMFYVSATLDWLLTNLPEELIGVGSKGDQFRLLRKDRWQLLRFIRIFSRRPIGEFLG